MKVNMLKSLLLTTVVVLLLPSNIYSATRVWIGAGSGIGAGTDINSAANWGAMSISSSDDFVMTLLDNASLTLSSNFTCNNLTISITGNNKVGSIAVNNYALTINGLTSCSVLIGNANTAFSFKLTSGTINYNGAVTCGVTPLIAASSKVYPWANNGATDITGKVIFRNTVTFNAGTYANPSTMSGNVVLDANGTQTINNNSSNVNYDGLQVGFANNPTVNFAGSAAYRLRGNATINGSSIANIGTVDFNRTTSGGVFYLNATSTLRLADNTGGQAGSNFPLNFTTYTLASGSTVHYNAANGINQTVYNGVTYGNLLLSNSSGVGSSVKTAGGSFVVNGNFTIQDAYTTYVDAGTIQIKGNVVLNGGVTSTNSWTLNGLGVQTISASALRIIYNLTIQNASGVNLNASIQVSNNLDMLAGILSTATYFVDLGTTGSISEITPNALNPSSYVLGTVKAQRNIGSTSGTQSFGNIGIQITETATTNNLTDVTRLTGASITKGASASVKRYFIITPVVDNSLVATLIFKYIDAELIGDESKYKLYKSDDAGLTWHKQDASVVNVAANYVSQSGITSFSDWTVSDTENHELPIQLHSFDAKQQENGVDINWVTASETNNESFIIEKSLDGISWEGIYMLDGAGTTTISQSYSFTDIAPISAITYYRLKQIDFDGNYSYSTIASVSATQSSSMYVFPTASSLDKQYIAIALEEPETIVISIASVFGTTSYTQQIYIAETNAQIPLSSLSLNLLNGSYVCSVTSSKGISKSTFIVQ